MAGAPYYIELSVCYGTEPHCFYGPFASEEAAEVALTAIPFVVGCTGSDDLRESVSLHIRTEDEALSLGLRVASNWFRPRNLHPFPPHTAEELRGEAAVALDRRSSLAV